MTGFLQKERALLNISLQRVRRHASVCLPSAGREWTYQNHEGSCLRVDTDVAMPLGHVCLGGGIMFSIGGFEHVTSEGQQLGQQPLSEHDQRGQPAPSSPRTGSKHLHGAYCLPNLYLLHFVALNFYFILHLPDFLECPL